MCGIAGYLDFDKGVNIRTLHAMTDIIRYRGPDDEGYLLFSEDGSLSMAGADTAKDCPVKQKLFDVMEDRSKWYLGFGHRRLSIIDLSAAGHQPMCNASSGLFITYNGEIYNYIELREVLFGEGFTFNTNTDTEVILRAYERWGEDCVSHFNGMWAFAIYDSKKQKLFCSRDRLGAKPFYYYRQGNHFVFGSEIKQICQDAELPRHMNEKLMLTTLLLRVQDFSEETLISEVKSLPGGCSLTLTFDVAGGRILSMEKRPYWELDTAKKGTGDLWYKNIQEAVKIRLRSDAPIGIMVSGGVDSTFLLNEICKYKSISQPEYAKSLDAFTSCYENAPEHDETYYAHLVNETWGTKEHLIYPDESDTLEVYKQMVWHYEDYAPFSTLGAFMTLKEVAKFGVKVIINGQGGDESMLGYERYYVYYLKDIMRKNPVRGLQTAAYIVKNSRLSYVQLLKYMIYFGIPKIRIAKNTKEGKKYLKKDFLDTFCPKDVLPVIQNDTFDELLYKELRKTQLTHILRMDDRGYMAYSMESRVPFIDYRYLEEAVKIPPVEKIQKGFTKYLLREKMQGAIPSDVIWRKSKNGWSSPAERWVKRFDKAEVENMLLNPVSEKYFNMDYIRKQWVLNPISQVIEDFFFTEVFMRQFHIVK